MLPFLLILSAFLVLGLGIWLWRRGRQAQSITGLPLGEVIYSDTSTWQRVDQSLLDRRHGLIGKPDYVIETKVDRRHAMIPVEVKSGRPPRTPHLGHLLQLGVYCLLVEAHYGQRPPHGLLHYTDVTWQIPFTPELEQEVLTAAAAIRHAEQAADVQRNHQEVARCAACGYRAACGKAALAHT